MMDLNRVYLEKAEESLEGAASELANRHYNNCANRSYYACFQAAIFALVHAGVASRGAERQWSHGFVQSQFAELINRRKLYPTILRDALTRNYGLRQAADYRLDRVTETEASRAVRRATEFVQAVRARGQ